jgi:hypothetical protein
LLPEVKAETWLTGQTFDLFAGSHDGYCRLPGRVVHRRTVFHVKGGLWFVRDTAEGQGSHLLESFWHFAPGLEVQEDQGVLLAKSAAPEKNRECAGMALFGDRNSGWTTEITEGFVSRAYGSKQVGSVVRLSASVTLPQDCGVLLLPISGASDIGTFAAIGERLFLGVRGYRYKTRHSAEFLFFSQGNGPWTCGPWTSDASLLYCKLEHSQFTHVIMVSGSFAEWRGKRFVSHSSSAESFEWSRPGSGKVFSHESDGVLVGDFEVLDSAT